MYKRKLVIPELSILVTIEGPVACSWIRCGARQTVLTAGSALDGRELTNGVVEYANHDIIGFHKVRRDGDTILSHMAKEFIRFRMNGNGVGERSGGRGGGEQMKMATVRATSRITRG